MALSTEGAGVQFGWLQRKALLFLQLILHPALQGGEAWQGEVMGAW